MSSLDLFSTSQTSSKPAFVHQKNADKKVYDECLNNAPFFAYQIEGKKYGIVQGCCNDWNCPRCGQQRAREEYGRIVAGSRKLAETHQLYFFTITCRGSDCTLEDAEANYLVWTNKLLTRLRTESKRAGKMWAYASVTERQDRLHPHSHYITTYCPDDVVFVAEGQSKNYCTSGEVFPAKHDTLQSYKLETACVDCGLGRQYDLSRVQNFEAGSRYMAKYLFKENIFTTKWPKGWRRVRYSQGWPKLPEIKGEAFPLIKKPDWWRLSRVAVSVVTKDDYAKKRATVELAHSDVLIY
jgi:hypothetical protein